MPMPPPNITGQLHLGHALFLSIQDAKTRFHAQIGDDALWLPGTDHAGLATHEKILDSLAQQGLDATDPALYMREAWSWKERLHGRITTQIRKMGAACDWSKERFTLDERSQRSALAAFSRCCSEGMLFRQDGEWFLRMDDLASQLLCALDAGEIRITPESSANELRNFLRNIEPWRLSRNISWGLPIPLETRGDEWRLSPSPQITQQAIGAAQSLTPSGSPDGWKPEPATFDTWFISALWPFSCLGWPEQTEDFQRYYPAAWMETADDILFFWCARMLMMGKLLTGQWPFREIYLHGIIRDSQGRKMSKSLGNGIDPLELIEKKGADSLRWMLLANAQPGLDAKFNPATLSSESKFLNKIWQAGRFLSPFAPLLATLPQNALAMQACSERNEALFADLNRLTSSWADHFRKNEFSLAARLIQRHFKDFFCDEWIERSKEKLKGGDALLAAEGFSLLSRYLALFHPFCPFLTSQLHEQLDLRLFA